MFVPSTLRRLALAGIAVLGLCSMSVAAELPAFKTGFIFTTHHSPFQVAASRGEAFRDLGVYLKPLVERESYELIKDGKPIAILDLVVAKSGSETATLFAQKHLDMGIASITAIMAGIDKGTPMKIVCPLQTEGMALVVPKDSSLTSWESLLQRVKDSKEPVKIGFHSPTSAPKIVLEGALVKAELKVTLDPSDSKADVLLVDLKETSNLLASLTAGQVEAVVGPSPFPEVAQTRGIGKVLVNLGELPPAGQWANFPCCVGVASEEMIAKHPEVVRAFVALISRVGAWFGVSSLATAMGLPRSELYYYLNNLKISMLFIIFIGALFPILTSAVHGVQTVNRTLVDSARVLGASERDIFTKILLPAAAPSIVNGLRIGLGVAWMCLVSAEMLPGSLSGVGYLITHAYTVGRTDVVIAGMISISVVGALLDMAFQWIERRKYAWKQFSR